MNAFYFAYVRVSTAKQGERGASLHEQRDAISAFAVRNGFNIVEWFEDRETAAKTGRKEFTRLLQGLKKRKAKGVIFHKIDRSARNLKDWSVIQELSELGVDVRFAHESVNLTSNEGRLTGDFLAVVASHFIRNLRDEVKKGMRGRLKQGLFPMKAPVGYLDQGGGKPKVPDPLRAPFVRKAFELYARGGYSLHQLEDELFASGFRSRMGNRVRKKDLSSVLRNPFYAGVIRLKRSGDTYAGIHQPIISAELFRHAQKVLDGKLNARPLTHSFLFRRMITCKQCNHRLIGELQKQYVYYRCHQCSRLCFKERLIDEVVWNNLAELEVSEEEYEEIKKGADELVAISAKAQADTVQAKELQIQNVKRRLERLMDVYLEQEVDKPLFQEKRLSLLLQMEELEKDRAELQSGTGTIVERALGDLELGISVQRHYKTANPSEKREMLKSLTSNFYVSGKDVVIELRSPFREIIELNSVPIGEPVRTNPRTRAQQILKILLGNAEAKGHTQQITF